MNRLDIFKLFKVAPAESDSNPEHEKLRRDVKKPGWLSVTPTPNDIRSDEEVNEEGERPLTHEALGRLGEGIMDRTEGLAGGYSQDTTPEELEEMKRVEDKKRTQEQVAQAFKTHPELRNSSAVQNLLKYITKASFIEELETSQKNPAPTSEREPTPLERQERQKQKLEEHEEIMDRLGAETAEAEETREERKGKLASARAGEPGALGRTIGSLGSTGLAAAAQQRGEGSQIPQGSLQSSPGGVGTGRASGINRAKIAQKPLGTAGKVPSMSTKVAQQKPRMSQPSRTQQMMEKDYEADKYEDEYEEYNVKERQPPSEMGTSGHSVKGLQQFIGRRAQQAKKKRGN